MCRAYEFVELIHDNTDPMSEPLQSFRKNYERTYRCNWFGTETIIWDDGSRSVFSHPRSCRSDCQIASGYAVTTVIRNRFLAGWITARSFTLVNKTVREQQEKLGLWCSRLAMNQEAKDDLASRILELLDAWRTRDWQKLRGH
jgi:hypothetical protein